MDISAYAAGISAGRYSVEREAWLSGAYGDAGVLLDFWDVSRATIGGIAQTENWSATYTRATTSALIPLDTGGTPTHYVHFWLDSDAEWTGFAWRTDASFDDLSLVIFE